MQCGKCSFDNPAGMRFCGRCGTPVALPCEACGFDNPPDFSFCGRCGNALPGGDPTAINLRVQAEATSERRQLTVLFCDLVGSTALAERLDPEELHEVVSLYQSSCNEVVERYGGYVAQYLGDGLMIYFGFPKAHEDDPHRAVHTGLGILDALANVNRELADKGVALSVRLGIHTGSVVTGEIGAGQRKEHLALGTTPNIASRLQALAEPGMLVLSAVTHLLVEGYFACESLGMRDLKGLSKPIEAFRVVETSGAASRLEAAAGQGLTPAVGRSGEIDELGAAFERVQTNGTELVLVTGEAGIGKSRLIELFQSRLEEQPHIWLTGRCSPYFINTALHPLTDLLVRTLGIERDDSVETKLEKLRRQIEPLELTEPQTLPLLAPLLDIPLAHEELEVTLSPIERKELTHQTLVQIITQIAMRRPTVLVVEDLHWIDPSSLELLGRLLSEASAAPLLVVLTSRPSFEPPWRRGPRFSRVDVERLGDAEVEDMVLGLTDGRPLPTEVLEQIVSRTDGVPLFVEELTRIVLDSDSIQEVDGRFELDGALGELAIPATLRDSLTARLDRLGSAREIAQLGATLGRDFSFEVLEAVAEQASEKLITELHRLVDAGLLFQDGAGSRATYSFKHALIQEAAYRSLLRRRRQEVHSRVALVLEERFYDLVEPKPELLAHHYTEARMHEPAVAAWESAGRKAADRAAHREAVSHFRRGLALIDSLPTGTERDTQELALQVALGPVLMAVKGFFSREVEAAYGRARHLAQAAGDSADLYPVVWGLVRYYGAVGRASTARDLSEQLVRLAQQSGKLDHQVEAHRMLGGNLFSLGEAEAAHEQLETALDIFREQGEARSQTFVFLQPSVFLLFFSGYVLWHLGRPDEAVERVSQAVELAEALNQPLHAAVAHTAAALVHFMRREPEPALEHADAVENLCQEHGFPDWREMAGAVSGWAMTVLGDGQGLATLEAAISARRKTDSKSGFSYLIAAYAEALLISGKLTAALAAAQEALSFVRDNEEHYYEAEILRLHGEIVLKAPGESEREQAGNWFRQALDVAQKQHGRSLELRIASSLARLHRLEGREGEARELLEERVEQFPAGTETPDLLEARALLAESASASAS